MEIKKLVERLNELYRESKERSLTPEEIQERDALRKEYLGLIRGQVQESLDQIEIVDQNGNPTGDHKH